MRSLNDITGVETFDASNATILDNVFQNCNLENLLPLKNWNISKVNMMFGTFTNFSQTATSLDGLEDWDTSSIQYMIAPFTFSKIESLTALKKWDMSNVIDFRNCFGRNSYLKSLDGLEDWNVSNTTDMTAMFQESYELEDISAIKNWNVSNVTNFSYMFSTTRKLENANSINDWNIKKDANFQSMFINSLTHPEFTKIEGTCNSGTFTPIE